MCTSDLSAKKYEKFCKDFPNITILTKSAMPGEFQLMFGHATVGNNSLGGSAMALALAGYLSSPSSVYVKIDIAFAAYGDKICLPIAEVLLRATAGNLARSKKQRDWTPHNAVLLLPFLAEAAILHGESDAGKLLNIFACSITEWAKEGENTSRKDDNNDKYSKVRVEAEGKYTTKTGKAK